MAINIYKISGEKTPFSFTRKTLSKLIEGNFLKMKTEIY